MQAETPNQLDRIESTLQTVLERLDKLEQDQRESNIRVETYQKSSQQVVNLAFSLILTSVVAILGQIILGR